MYTMLLFDTSTHAMHAKRVLQAISIPSQLHRSSGKTGCRHTLVVESTLLYSAVTELRRLGIPFEITHG